MPVVDAVLPPAAHAANAAAVVRVNESGRERVEELHGRSRRTVEGYLVIVSVSKMGSVASVRSSCASSFRVVCVAVSMP